MKYRDVATETLLTPAEFDAYTRPGGEPVVIKGWMHGWRAMSEWDFDYFKTHYGEDKVNLACDAMSGASDLVTTMADYIDYLTAHEPTTKLHQDHARLGARHPFYCTSYKPFFDHPELREDIGLPPFALDWWPYFDLEFQRAHFPYHQGWVLISPPDALSRLHIDSHHTITQLAQIKGRKEAYLFAPEEAELVYRGDVDPANPDYDRFPDLREATCYRTTLLPGDMLFLPPDWWHHVVTREHSITVSQNLVNHTNFGLYIRYALRGNLTRFLQAIPPAGIAEPAAASREMSDA